MKTKAWLLSRPVAINVYPIAQECYLRLWFMLQGIYPISTHIFFFTRLFDSIIDINVGATLSFLD